MRERLLEVIRNEGYPSYMDSDDIHEAWPHEMLDAILEELRKPDMFIILAGADVPDSVTRFWPIMVDTIARKE